MCGTAADALRGFYAVVMDTTTERGWRLAAWTLTILAAITAIMFVLVIGPWAD